MDAYQKKKWMYLRGKRWLRQGSEPLSPGSLHNTSAMSTVAETSFWEPRVCVSRKLEPGAWAGSESWGSIRPGTWVWTETSELLNWAPAPTLSVTFFSSFFFFFKVYVPLESAAKYRFILAIKEDNWNFVNSRFCVTGYYWIHELLYFKM